MHENFKETRQKFVLASKCKDAQIIRNALYGQMDAYKINNFFSNEWHELPGQLADYVQQTRTDIKRIFFSLSQLFDA